MPFHLKRFISDYVIYCVFGAGLIGDQRHETAVTGGCEWPDIVVGTQGGSSEEQYQILTASGSISPGLILWILGVYQTQYAAKDDPKLLILSEVVRLHHVCIHAVPGTEPRALCVLATNCLLQ